MLRVKRIAIVIPGAADRRCRHVLQNAALADHAQGATCRVGASTEAEQVDLIAGFIVLRDKLVSLLDVVVQAVAQGAAAKAIPERASDANTIDVVDALLGGRLVWTALKYRVLELADVGLLRFGRVVPGTVATDHDALHVEPFVSVLSGEIIAKSGGIGQAEWH